MYFEGKYLRLTLVQWGRLDFAFPELNIMENCRDADLWLETHPGKRKLSKPHLHLRFITNWLKIERQKAQTVAPALRVGIGPTGRAKPEAIARAQARLAREW